MANPFLSSLIDGYDADLLQSLNDEVIYTKGIEIEYMPRTVMRKDPIMNEALSSQFEDVKVLDAFVLSSELFFPGNEIFGPVGLQFGPTASSLMVSRREFIRITGMQEPVEGDLIFVKANKLLFEITNVNNRDPLISGGRMFSFVIYMHPYQAGEGNTSFPVDKFKTSKTLSEFLDYLTDETEQKKWTENWHDFSSTHVTFDSTEITMDQDKHYSPGIIRFDSTLLTFDSTAYTFDDSLTSWDDSKEEVLEMLDENLTYQPMNKEFECNRAGVKIETNPFGFT